MTDDHDMTLFCSHKNLHNVSTKQPATVIQRLFGSGREAGEDNKITLGIN